jgi:L-ascorbate metabolism protein UlaG (beta-lactamase superfamily)
MVARWFSLGCGGGVDQLSVLVPESSGMSSVTITLIGGPTALIEVDGYRLITDPTFDMPGQYRLPHATLTKTEKPAMAATQVGPIDAVLLSHDQHADNLDNEGRALLSKAGRVLTTVAGARRLGGRAEGLEPWGSVEMAKPDGAKLRVTATPARHGPVGIEPLSGDVVGFVLNGREGNGRPVYITGDTVWYGGVAEVARRFPVGVVVLFAGAAQTRGHLHLTMDANDAVETAHAFPDAVIVPVHCDGWAHLTQDRHDLEVSFKILGLESRLRLLEPGLPAIIGC